MFAEQTQREKDSKLSQHDHHGRKLVVSLLRSNGLRELPQYWLKTKTQQSPRIASGHAATNSTPCCRKDKPLRGKKTGAQLFPAG